MSAEQTETTSVDADEIAKFRAMAAEWWDPHGKFRPLHKFNPVRLGLIRDRICDHFGLDAQSKRPFKGLRILDIGCGGGLVSEPMTRLGARVTGVDAGGKNIATARQHAADNGLDIDYRAGTAEALLAQGEPAFDVVLNLEVVEHVADVQSFLINTAKLVRPGGMMALATLNRTPKAFALAIVGAEYVLGWLPRGTHEFNKFVRPTEAQKGLEAGGLKSEPPIGLSFNPVLDRWSVTGDTAVNYIMFAADLDEPVQRGFFPKLSPWLT